MLKQVEPRPRRSVGGAAAQWAGLLVSATLLSALLDLTGFPAALLLGPMLAAVGFGISGATVSVPRVLFLLAQGVAGCLVARSLTPSTLIEIVHDWPVLVAAISMTLLSSGIVGVAFGRIGNMPRDAAIWGFLPGMAGAMVALAHEYKADARLVAFVQYTRLVVVILVMSIVTRLVTEPSVTLSGASAQSPASDAFHVVATLLVASLALLGGRLRFLPAGSMLVPMVVAAALQTTDTLPVTLPGPLLSAAYAVIGFQVGLRFTRATILAVLRLVPIVLAGSLALVLLCSASAMLLTGLLGIDPLTAFLAMVPGSIDSVAIIAIGSNADVSFVMALQTVRMFAVILLGPPLARFALRVVR